MNQAAKLDLIMQKTKQKSVGISVLTTSDVESVEGFLELFVLYYSEKTNKTILLTNETRKENRREILSTHVTVVHDFFKPIEEKKYRNFLETIEKQEEKNQLFLHYTGNCLQAEALTKSRLSQKVVLIARPTEQSKKEVEAFLKVIEAKKFHQPISLIIDTENKEVCNEYLNTLQEISRNRINYFIEPIGYASLKHARIKKDEEVYETLKLRFFDQLDAQAYSSYVEKCLFGG